MSFRGFRLARCLHSVPPMPAPLMILPGQYYELTRRTVFRMFLLRPSAFANNAFVYCMAVAAKRTNVDIILPAAMSNHHHTVLYDRDGRICEFAHYFHWLFALIMNAHLGHSGPFWAPNKRSYVRLIGRKAVVKKIVYAATNPVKDNAVEKVREWPGVNGLAHLFSGAPLVAHRPKVPVLRSIDSTLPDIATLTLTIPPELGAREEILKEVRLAVEKVEISQAKQRERRGIKVLGAKAVLKASPYTVARKAERQELSPRFAGPKKERVLAMLELRAFFAAYRAARAVMNTHAAIPFPRGTYALRHFSNVSVVGEPDIQPPPPKPDRRRRPGRPRLVPPPPLELGVAAQTHASSFVDHSSSPG